MYENNSLLKICVYLPNNDFNSKPVPISIPMPFGIGMDMGTGSHRTECINAQFIYENLCVMCIQTIFL